MEHAPCQTEEMAFAVLTRDPADTVVYAAALLLLEVVAMPVTRTAAPLDPAELERLLAAGVDAVVVASPRAAQQLARAGLRDGPAVWAVGPATRRALEIAKIPAQVPHGVRDGMELARAVIAGGVRGKKILVPRAEEASVGAGIDDAIVANRRGNRHTRWHRARRQQVRHHGPGMRKVVAIALIPRHHQRVVDLAGERVIDAHFVQIAGVGVRADDRHLRLCLLRLYQRTGADRFLYVSGGRAS